MARASVTRAVCPDFHSQLLREPQLIVAVFADHAQRIHRAHQMSHRIIGKLLRAPPLPGSACAGSRPDHWSDAGWFVQTAGFEREFCPDKEMISLKNQTVRNNHYLVEQQCIHIIKANDKKIITQKQKTIFMERSKNLRYWSLISFCTLEHECKNLKSSGKGCITLYPWLFVYLKVL